MYDALGQRYSKQDPGSNPTTYIYDLDGNLIEENDNGAVTDYIYNNRTLVGLFIPSTTTLYYVHTNYQNTPIAVTNSSQAVVWSTTYQPYGTTSIPGGSISQNIRLPGQYSDTETGFYYNMNRDYMPNLGRYLEADPIGLKGGMNPYLYARANPVKFTDRSGLICLDDLTIAQLAKDLNLDDATVIALISRQEVTSLVAGAVALVTSFFPTQDPKYFPPQQGPTNIEDVKNGTETTVETAQNASSEVTVQTTTEVLPTAAAAAPTPSWAWPVARVLGSIIAAGAVIFTPSEAY